MRETIIRLLADEQQKIDDTKDPAKRNRMNAALKRKLAALALNRQYDRFRIAHRRTPSDKTPQWQQEPSYGRRNRRRGPEAERLLEGRVKSLMRTPQEVQRDYTNKDLPHGKWNGLYPTGHGLFDFVGFRGRSILTLGTMTPQTDSLLRIIGLTRRNNPPPQPILGELEGGRPADAGGPPIESLPLPPGAEPGAPPTSDAVGPHEPSSQGQAPEVIPPPPAQQDPGPHTA